MQTPQQIQRLAKVLAPLLGGKPCEVTIGGQKAYTTGSSINIPAGDFEDPSYVAMVHGYIDHELGHNAWTDFNVSRAAKAESSVLNKFRNALEDVRMEFLQGEAWPGAKINLNRLATICVAKGFFPPVQDMETPTKQVMYNCLYWGRYHINQQYALANLADDAETNLREQLGDELVENIQSELQNLKHAKSNQDCLDIARAILKLLESEAQDEEDSQGNSDDGENQDSDNTEQQGDEESDEPNTETKAEGEAVNDSSNAEGDSNKTAKQFIQAVLSASDDDDVQDIHEIIAKELESYANKAAQEGRVTDLEGFDSQLGELTQARSGYPVDVAGAKSTGRRAYKTIRRALIDSSMNQRVLARTGKRIAKRRLAGVVAGSQSVFERQSEKPEPTCAVSLLIDASGSMSGARQKAVGSSALALAYGLNASNIKVQTTFYGVRDSGSNHLYRAKRFEDKQIVDSNFSVISEGSTPTGEAMQAEILELVNRKEDKKFLFVLTDGAPNDLSKVRSAVDVAKKAGIRVIPIGINTSRMLGFEGLPFKSLTDLSELEGVLKHALSEGLLN